MAKLFYRIELEHQKLTGQKEDELSDYFEKEINDHLEQMGELLIDDLSQFDIRAEYCNDSLSIELVEWKSKVRYLLQYSYEWQAHYGCRDMCKSDYVDKEIEFTFKDEQLIFEKDIIEPRTTFEEF